MALKTALPKMSHAQTTRPSVRRPAMAQRRSAPSMQEGWEDVFDKGGGGLGHNSPSLDRRRRSAHGTPRKSGSAHGPGINPFDANFAESLRSSGVKTKPCRSAAPDVAANSDKPKVAPRFAELRAAWLECREFFAKIVALVVEDLLANLMNTDAAKKAKGHASAYAARAGANMGANMGAAAGGATAGPAGAAVG